MEFVNAELVDKEGKLNIRIHTGVNVPARPSKSMARWEGVHQQAENSRSGGQVHSLLSALYEG